MFSWQLDALYGHVYRLFDTIVSTKEPLEDSFSTIANKIRSQNKNYRTSTLERLWFIMTMSPRMNREEFPLAHLTEVDVFDRGARRQHQTQAVFFPAQHVRRSSDVCDKIKRDTCARGSALYTKRTCRCLKFNAVNPKSQACLALHFFNARSFGREHFDCRFIAWHPSGNKNTTKSCGLRARKDQVYRPAGQQGEFRSVSAFLAMKLSRQSSFRDVGSMWKGLVFLPGHIYLEKSSGQFLLCLGFHFLTGLAWRLEEVLPGVFAPAKAQDLVVMTATVLGKPGKPEDEALAGVPASVCTLVEPES